MPGTIYGYEALLPTGYYEVHCTECGPITAQGATEHLTLTQRDQAIAEIDGLPVRCTRCNDVLLEKGANYV